MSRLFCKTLPLILAFLAAVVPISNQAFAQNSRSLAAFERGCGQMRHKNFAAAIGSFDEAISDDGNDVNAYFRRGQSFFCLGKYQDAVIDFDRAAAKGAMDPNLYLWAGTSYSKLGKNDLAVINYERAMRLNPKLADNYLSATRADNLIVSGTNGASQTIPDKNKKPTVSDTPILTESDKAIGITADKGVAVTADKANNTAVDKAIAKTSAGPEGTNKSSPALLTKATPGSNLGANQPAVEAYITAVKNVTQNATGYFRPGIVYSGILNQSGNVVPLGEIDFDSSTNETIAPSQTTTSADLRKSLRLLDGQINEQPQAAKLFFRRALIRQRLKQPTECLADLTRAINLDKTNPHLYLARAFYYFQQDKPDAAAADIRMAQELNPIVPGELSFEPTTKKNESSKL